MNNISSVCWDITSKCNDNCKFCFRDALSVDLPLDKNILLVDKFINYGIKKITFTGGEASLYPDLWKLIQYAHDHGIYTNLVTNAIHTNDDFYTDIEKYLNCITLSIDGADSATQIKMTRNMKHFDNVIDVLEKIDKNKIKIKKKINTLVSKINFDSVIYILPILYKYKVNVWKLFQFIAPRYSAELHEKDFLVSDDDFVNLEEEIKRRHKGNVPKLIFQPKKCLETSYFVVSSNGNVRYDGKEKSNIIGNILNEDIEHIFNKISFNYTDYKKRKSYENLSDRVDTR